MVKNGVLVSRPSTGVAARRTGDEQDVTPIFTSAYRVQQNISTTMTSKKWTDTSRITVTVPNMEGRVSLRVLGVATIPMAGVPGSKIAVYLTRIGNFVLKGSELFAAVDEFAAYASPTAGFLISSALSGDGAPGQRRSDSTQSQVGSCTDPLSCMD